MRGARRERGRDKLCASSHADRHPPLRQRGADVEDDNARVRAREDGLVRRLSAAQQRLQEQLLELQRLRNGSRVRELQLHIKRVRRARARIMQSFRV